MNKKEKYEIDFGQSFYRDFSKKDVYNILFDNFLIKILDIIKWNNLPENVSSRNIELSLLKYGYTSFFKLDDVYYSTFASMAPPLNYEYLGTKALLTNPYIKDSSFQQYLDINKDCVIIRNNDLYKNSLDIVHYYISMITELVVSLRMISINSRNPYLLDSDSSQDIEDNKNFIDKIMDGELIGILKRTPMLDGIKSSQIGSVPYLKEILESIQYFTAKLYNEFGLQSNYNMKRESLNDGEIGSNTDTIVSNILTMFECRKKACEQINKLFGLNIDVELNLPLYKNVEKIKKEIKEYENPDKIKENSQV